MQKRRYEVIHALLYAALAYKIAYPLWLVLGASYLRSINFISDFYYHLSKFLLTPTTTGSIGLLCSLALVPHRALFKSVLTLLFMLSLLPTIREVTTFLHDLNTITPPGVITPKWETSDYLSFFGFCLRSFFPLILFGVLLSAIRRWKNSHD